MDHWDWINTAREIGLVSEYLKTIRFAEEKGIPLDVFAQLIIGKTAQMLLERYPSKVVTAMMDNAVEFGMGLLEYKKKKEND